jgi:hypothetical protein
VHLHLDRIPDQTESVLQNVADLPNHLVPLRLLHLVLEVDSVLCSVRRIETLLLLDHLLLKESHATPMKGLCRDRNQHLLIFLLLILLVLLRVVHDWIPNRSHFVSLIWIVSHDLFCSPPFRKYVRHKVRGIERGLHKLPLYSKRVFWMGDIPSIHFPPSPLQSPVHNHPLLQGKKKTLKKAFTFLLSRFISQITTHRSVRIK